MPPRDDWEPRTASEGSAPLLCLQAASVLTDFMSWGDEEGCLSIGNPIDYRFKISLEKKTRRSFSWRGSFGLSFSLGIDHIRARATNMDPSYRSLATFS
jgi:hypothetical protein